MLVALQSSSDRFRIETVKPCLYELKSQPTHVGWPGSRLIQTRHKGKFGRDKMTAYKWGISGLLHDTMGAAIRCRLVVLMGDVLMWVKTDMRDDMWKLL